MPHWFCPAVMGAPAGGTTAHDTVLVDAYNVLHKIPALHDLLRSNADAARRALVERIRARTRPRERVIVVFDAFGETIAPGGGVTVVFTLTRTADAWIRERLEREARPRAVLVVSSDTEVRLHARALGASVLGAEEYLRGGEGGRPPEREKPDADALSKRDIEEWRRLFEGG